MFASLSVRDSIATIDDNDPGIRYTGAWVREGAPSELDASVDYLSCTTCVAEADVFAG